MSSNTVDISDQDVDNNPPLESLSCTNNTNDLSISNPPSIKRNSYIKQRGRRRRWWYFNRGLQPISELAEIKDVKDDAVKSENHDAHSPTIVDDSYVINNYSPTNNTIISSDSTQNKEGYSACLKLIEKFQEVVMDSAVRVIQAAFKRFRERRRFLRIKRAVMVIQRNLRKWLETKHPCIRPTDFERQSSDGSKSDDYRETIEHECDGFVTEEKANQLSFNESEKCQEYNDTNGNENSVEDSTVNFQQENKCTFDAENVNAELELNDKAVNDCLSESGEEAVGSSAAEDEKLVTMSAEEEQGIVQDVKSLLEELLVKVVSNVSDTDVHNNQSEESKDLITNIDTTDICPSGELIHEEENIVETQEKPLNKINIDGEQNDLHRENENHDETTGDLEDKAEHLPRVTTSSPNSLKIICQKTIHASEISKSHYMEDAES